MPKKLDSELIRYINLKLAALGEPTNHATTDPAALELTGSLLRNHHQKDEQLGWRMSPVNIRIQSYLDDLLKDVCPNGVPRLPQKTFVLDRAGLARALSFSPTNDYFESTYLNSYRTQQGVLHNPRSDRRTTSGVFHVAEGGFPVPDDKIAVPKAAFARLLEEALKPPKGVLTLPFTSDQPDKAQLFVSLLMRPAICPATDRDPAKSMEIRFFAPGTLVSNLDFVEGIFGNAGDPYLPENNSALDVEHWSGHTGCVILAPHLPLLKKKDLGLPHYDQANERQRRDGMCWKNENELYNGGNAFKVASRDHRGVMVTVIADNYYGYCKKEVKTQISYAANLYGMCEEEHAGGALAYPTYVLGQDFYADRSFVLKETTFEDALKLLGDRVDVKPGRYAVDKKYSNIYYVPENAAFNVREGTVSWSHNSGKNHLILRPEDTYIIPSGYKVRLEKQAGGTAWRLIGSRPDGTFCHKPSTVSGGGKSEISKSISSMIQHAPVFVKDYQRDLNAVEEILKKDFSKIYRKAPEGDLIARANRPLLSSERSLGSVIKLFTPSPTYTDEYNAWLGQLSQTIRQMVFAVKRYWRPEWETHWREHFTVDHINGYPGHELKCDNQRLIANYLRVGFDQENAWRMYKLRPDFNPADKVQMEDDITVSAVVPRERLSDLDVNYNNPSVKLVANAESLLFQRPDDAIIRGFDHQAELDISTPGTFLSNFEPLNHQQAQDLIDHVVEFDQYTQPMKQLLLDFVQAPQADFVVSSAHPRLVNGKPSKNPRYLQNRPDRTHHRETHVAEMGARLNRETPSDKKIFFPVRAVLPGRRNNPAQPEIGLPALAVYNPVHYQELPELFMDFLSSLTGKSPSTTGFGSEGALTKGPFNALWPVVDMNNSLVSFILTGYAGFTSAAGYVGPKFSMEHDISMLVPEVWCRMQIFERDPKFLIQNGYLEKINDFEYQGRQVSASRLGYRITSLFMDHFLGRLFETPNAVFTEDMLKPEKQDMAAFVTGVNNIVESQNRVARGYFSDGSIEAACPPLKALLHIMANGHYEGKDVNHPDIRNLFTRESMISSEWYKERLRTKQQRDLALWQRHLHALEAFRNAPENTLTEINQRLETVHRQMARVSSPDYLNELVGTIGADPFYLQMAASTDQAKQPFPFVAA